MMGYITAKGDEFAIGENRGREIDVRQMRGVRSIRIVGDEDITVIHVGDGNRLDQAAHLALH